MLNEFKQIISISPESIRFTEKACQRFSDYFRGIELNSRKFTQYQKRNGDEPDTGREFCSLNIIFDGKFIRFVDFKLDFDFVNFKQRNYGFVL